METHYTTLGCDENSSFEEIKKKYQELALKYHPDKSKMGHDYDKEKFPRINKAWNVLKDMVSRNKYNAELKQAKLIDLPLVHATLNIEEFRDNIEKHLFTYPCRCGATYRLQDDELLSPECILECDECSFSIVIYS